MNALKYISTLALSLLFCTACESDLDQTVYHESEAIPAQLSGLDDSYVLDKNKGNETAFTLEWTKPDMTYQAAVTNMLQMDLAEKSFSQPITLAASTNEVQYSITVGDLNKQIMTLLSKYDIELPDGESVDVAFRIGSSISTVIDTLFSNVLTSAITPYAGEAVYPSIAVRGSYSGWDFNNSQLIYSINSDNNYAGMVYFNGKAQEGWKMCGDENWTVDNWGAGSDMSEEAPQVTLIQNGNDNIITYSKNSYWVEFNNSTGVLKMNQAHDSWGLVGDFNGWGGNGNDTELSYGMDDNGFYLMAVQNLNEGEGWKIRPDGNWGDDKGPQQLAYEGDVSDKGDGNFTVTGGNGNYEVKWYFNKPEQKLIVTKQ